MKKQKTAKKKLSGKKILHARKVGRIHAVADPDWMDDTSMYKPIKKPVTLRLDADVLAWFQKQGKGYQTRINQTLREVVAKARKKG